MELRFTRPSLRRLDLAGTEVLVAGMSTDERPLHGLAGLVDWRLCGKLSSALGSGFASGRRGEVLMVPGRPKLPFDKVVLFGIGAVKEFNEHVYRVVVEQVLATLEGLRVRSAVVELPGRHFGAIAAERAADILLELCAGRPEHDVWTLVDDAEAERAIAQHLVQERRRQRHL
ncbi:MAG TPA: M17 family peptidase N-terminal domain-containing protein [Polyangiaceae bacterium]|jgi:hypothetical protein